MLNVKIRQATESLDYFCEKTYEDKEPIRIELEDGNKVILLSEKEYEKLTRPL